ncbi:MAG: winged helix-turn-helix domain-containing protein [Thermomicrobiales bacterium]
MIAPARTRGDRDGSAAAVECLTIAEARALATIASRLDRRPRQTRDSATQKARLLEMIRHLGCVQLDTISVVSRAHETAFWSRLGTYDPANLASLHYPEGLITEYWAHAAAIIPVETFPYFRGAMDAYRAKYDQHAWIIENREVVTGVLERIRENGATVSRHFERPDGRKPEAWEWYGGKPARQALDHLWSCGDIMVARRESGFQRVYDITERVIPDEFLLSRPTAEERQRFFMTGALRALGVTTARWAADYFRDWARPYSTAKASALGLETLAQEGLAIPVSGEGFTDPVWLDPVLLPRLADLRAGKSRPTLTTLLSPFDNLIWNRGRMADLWDFQYRIEVYTPAPKRIYGYYTMPILHRGHLVGRLDPSLDRKNRILTVRKVFLEPGEPATDSLATSIASALWDFAGFLGADEVLLLAAEPEPFTPMLAGALSRPAA